MKNAITLKEIFKLVSVYKFFITPRVIAMKINAPWTAGVIAPIIAYGLYFNSTQYGVFSICVPFAPIGTIIHMVKTRCHHIAKQVRTDSLFL